MSEWKDYNLGEFVESISETYKFKPNEEVVFLNTSDILLGKVLNKNPENSTKLPGQAKKRIQKGDFLFSEIRPANGRYAFIDFEAEKYVVSTKLMVLRCNKKIDVNFFRLFLTSKEILDHLQMLAEDRSGTFPQITFDHISSLEITLPPLPEQQSIASILSSLDDKIDLLHRQNATLEKMAETLFRQWFVDEAIVQSENQILLGDLIESVSITHKFPNNNVVFLNTSDIYLGNVLVHDPLDVKTLPGQAKKTIKKGDILFSEIRPANGRWAYIDFEADNYVVSTKLMVLRSKGKINQAFIYFYLTNSEVVNWLQMIAESRSGTFPQITFDQLKDLVINVPSNEILEFATSWCELTLTKIKSNQTQIRTLTALRDTLLPKLMSGEVKVN